MSDALWAARLGDALNHTSMMADILGGVLEVAANIAITALATAAVVAATGITVVTGGLGCFVLGLVVGTIVGLAMSKTGADKGLSNICEGIGNALFPPTVQANILTGSTDTLTNNIPAARAAGAIESHVAPAGTELEAPEPEEDPSYLDMAGNFFSQMWRPTVATPAPGAVPKPEDLVICMKHPPMPPQFMAEGSDKVTINGQPAVRSGDRSTCDATVVSAGLISPNVTIGGGSVVVREIRSGKTPGVGLAVTALLMLKGSKGKFFSKLPCMLVGGAVSMAASSAANAAANAALGSSNPVHAATGAKVLGGDEELDFVLPGILPIDWQRVYNSRDERRDSLFGAGWSVAYEVQVQIQPHPDGGETLVYTDEQGRPIDMGSIPLGGAVFSAGEGLAVRRHVNGQLLIESDDGLYRLFEPSPANSSHLRLSQLGDRNDNRIHLDYDDAGRLVRLRDTFDLVQVELIRAGERVTHIERLYPDQTREVLVSYAYDAANTLAEVRDATGQVQRRFSYDAGQRMVEHQLPSGLHCFYEWALIDDQEWRVVRHWTDEGDAYQFDYDLKAGITRISDSLQRVSTRHWNSQHQITQFTDNLGQTWLFEWNDERQLLSATDPQGGQYTFSYDEAGNLLSETDPLGRSESTLWLEHWPCRWWTPTPPATAGNTATINAATARRKPTRWATSPATATTPMAKSWRSSTPPAKARSCAGTRLGNWWNTLIARVTRRASAMTSGATCKPSPTPSASAPNSATTPKGACSAANCRTAAPNTTSATPPATSPATPTRPGTPRATNTTAAARSANAPTPRAGRCNLPTTASAGCKR